jgi:drug/metabolite transporter (DMT)-like permease
MLAKKQLYAWLAMAAAVTMWGFSFLSIKITVLVLPVMTQALLRHVIATVAISVMLWMIKSKERLDKKDMPLFVFAGFLSVTLYFFFENSGMQKISASSGALIIAIIPILTMIADAIVFKVNITFWKIISVILSFLGVYLIVGMGSKGGSEEFMGYMLMLGASVSWVIYSLVTKSLTQKYSEMVIVYYQILFGTITLIPFALFEKTNWSAIDTNILLNLIFLGVFCSAVATYFYVIGIDRIGVGASALMMNLIPVVAVIASCLFLRETTSLTQMIGGSFIILAVFLSTVKTKGEKTINLDSTQ